MRKNHHSPSVWHIWALSLACALLSTFAHAQSARVDSLYEKLTYRSPLGDTLRYRLLKPKNYQPDQKYPLVLFLHGAGERGNDNTKQLVHGAYLFTEPANLDPYPCFVLAPQCPTGLDWANMDWRKGNNTQAQLPARSFTITLELIDELAKAYRIDPKRFYITGLSMGGYGTWDAITRYPKKFAAAVPICGGGDPAKAALAKKVPIWNFHGAKDVVVPVARSREMIKALEAAGAKPKYTEYPEENHASWVPAYKEPGLLPWLFAQKR